MCWGRGRRRLTPAAPSGRWRTCCCAQKRDRVSQCSRNGRGGWWSAGSLHLVRHGGADRAARAEAANKSTTWVSFVVSNIENRCCSSCCCFCTPSGCRNGSRTAQSKTRKSMSGNRIERAGSGDRFDLAEAYVAASKVSKDRVLSKHASKSLSAQGQRNGEEAVRCARLTKLL